MLFIFFGSLGQFSTMYFTTCLAIRFLSSLRKSRYQNRNDCIEDEMCTSALPSMLVRRGSADAAADDEELETASDLAVEAADNLVEALGAADPAEALGAAAFGAPSACKASHCFLFIILLLPLQNLTDLQALAN